jgi:uncharacterized protein (TIGR03437 family)
VLVKDALGTERPAPVMYVSAEQINLVIPDGVAPGPATFSISNGIGPPLTTIATVRATAPRLFSMRGDGTGVAAATAYRAQVSDPDLQGAVAVFQCGPAGCIAAPIDLGLDTVVYVTLYGTGIRNRSSLDRVAVTVHGESVPALYAGPQPTFEGLDQVNLALPLTLRGAGEVNVSITVDGEISNTVTLAIQ